MTYQQHPLSAAFPAMSVDEYQALKDSIENIGVKNAITIYEGMVLDGWNRYQVAQELDLPCPTQDLDPEDDPRDFVLAQNKTRRHITQAQLIAAASKVFAWAPVGRNQHGSALSADPPVTSKQLAERLGVGVRSVEQFRAVERTAAPQVVQAVEAGEIGLPKAAAIAQLPTEQQAEAIKAPLSKTVKHRGRPKKVAAVKLVNAEIKAAQATQAQTAAEERTHQLQDELRVVREQLTEAQEDMASVSKVLDSGDQLAAALAEAKKFRELAGGLQARVNSMTAEIADLKRSVAYWEKKAKAVAA